MCGFGLVFSKKDKIPHNLIKIAENDLGLRGPSHATHYLGDDIYMYQSVLAIQTEPDRDDGFASLPHNFDVTLYNGEIYDEHEYDSDIEMLQKSSAKQLVLGRCDGMFAVVQAQRQGQWLDITALRDIQGEKRIFYYDNPRVLILGSTPSFILKVMEEFDEPVTLNEVALKDYFVTRHYISNSTAINGIYQVPPGGKFHYNKYSSVTQVWTPRKYLNSELTRELNKTTSGQYTHYLEELLIRTLKKMQSSVRPHVNVYSTVSGGTDSSIVTKLLENIGTQLVRGITLTFDEKDSVSLFADKLFDKLYTGQLVRNVDRDSYYESYLQTLKLCCSPIPSHDFASANLLYEMLEPGSILYGGEGADELFLGYKYYQNCVRSEYTMSVRNNFKLSFSENIQEDYEYAFQFFIDNLYSTKDAHIKACSFVDFFHQMPNATLMSGDLIGSSHGIETRTPFTRKDIVTYALNSPPYLLDNKRPLSKIFENHYKRRPYAKIGFSGHPNEMYRYLENGIDKSYDIYGSYVQSPYNDRDTEWKYINTEFFLDTFCFTP